MLIFEKFKKIHIPIFKSWLEKDHVKDHWQESDNLVILEKKFLIDLPERSVHPYVFRIEETLAGYIQYYNASKIGGGWWEDEDKDVYGIDMMIGNEKFLSKGYGPRVLKDFIPFLLSTENSVSSIIIDPDPSNLRAIAAFEKAGFKREKQITTPNGCSLLMRLTL